MRGVIWLSILGALGMLAGYCGEARAAPGLRHQVIQRGGFALIGNTMGYDCSLLDENAFSGSTEPVPVLEPAALVCDAAYAGELARTQPTAADSALDIYFGATASNVEPSLDVLPEAATSGAALELPTGARVTHARLYWAGLLTRAETGAVPEPDSELEITLSTLSGEWKSVSSEAAPIVVSRCANGCSADAGGANDYFYQGSADVTPLLVGLTAPGTVSVRGIRSFPEPGGVNDSVISAWWMVVFYENAGAPLSSLALYDGLDLLGNNQYTETPWEQSITLEANVPATGEELPMLLGVVGYEGDSTDGSDYVRIGEIDLQDNLNPGQNLFNSTRSNLGVPATRPLDAPFLDGGPRSMAGIDIDVFDIGEFAELGEGPLTITAGSRYDTVLLSAFVTAITTTAPLLDPRTMTVTPIGGGAFALGSEVEYVVSVQNTGTDSATAIVFEDALPGELHLVPGSTSIRYGDVVATAPDPIENVISLDLGEVLGQTPALAPGQSLEIRFRALIPETLTSCLATPCTIRNQGQLTYAGLAGAASTSVHTDGDGSIPGDGTTDFVVGGCSANAPCAAPLVCVEGLCVACAEDADCPDATPRCIENSCAECGAAADCTDSLAPVCATGVCVGCLENADCTDAELPVCLDRTCVAATCGADIECAAPTPRCHEGECVECAEDIDCGDVLRPSCDDSTHLCVCRPDDPSCAGSRDDDGDGLTNAEEEDKGTDPNDADSDDDGVLDGAEWSPAADSDGDGRVNALDPDSDNDGVLDGTELGLDCEDPATNPEALHCRPDADPETTTDPTLRDSDGGGASDGSEDFDFDGRVDAEEADPNDGGDDTSVADEDGDGLGDAMEETLASDPEDADTDDDGAPDGAEPDPSIDDDRDGLGSVRDVDTDNDALFDGTELGFGCDGEGTDADRGHCTPDADPATVTSPVLADTDRGGVSDGSEDYDLDGAIDDGETDPLDPADDGTVVDSDGDGLGDDLESTLGSDPHDADSDDDGVLDGLEPNPGDDLDGDGLSGVLDGDADGDGLLDGVEAGTTCRSPDSSPAVCVLDGDAGLTTTGILVGDTDGDGVLDGIADANHDGVIDSLDARFVNGDIRGGGCACRAAGEPDAPRSALLLLLGAALLIRRRHDRRR